MAHVMCDCCGEVHKDVELRADGIHECLLCWQSALEHGHAHGLHQDEEANPVQVADCPTCGSIPVFTVRLVWLADGRDEQRAYRATALSEALTMAEREHAGVDGPDVYGIRVEDYRLAEIEGIAFNSADGLLI